jgi:hypothetical protein
MAKYTAWVIRKQYFKVEVEADSWEQARDNALSADVNIDKPDDIDWDIYDVEEMKQ